MQRMSSMARAPDMTQRMPERSMRSLTTQRQAPSMTPEAMKPYSSRRLAMRWALLWKYPQMRSSVSRRLP